MKKFTSVVFTLFLSIAAYHALGTNFYSENFSGGIPGTWQNIDSAGNGIKWRWTTTGAFNNSFPFDNALSTTGTTASNGYVIFDSDSAFPDYGDGLLVTNAINCSGKSNVHLTFNEYFAQYLSSMGIVSVSNDGVNWTPIHDAEAGLGQDQTTANPDAVDIDISSIADNQTTVYLMFRYTGQGEYFWMVDDIGLYEVPANDGGVNSVLSPGSTCSLLTSAESITVDIVNFGASQLTNFLAYYSVDGNSPISELVTDTIQAGGNLSYTFVTTVDLSAPGYHTIKSFTGVSSDANTLNDTTSIKFFNGPRTPTPTADYTQGFELPAEDTIGWSTFDGNNDATIWGISSQFAHSGSYCANFTNDLPSNAGDDWLFTPCLGLADSTNTYYELYFSYRSFTNYSALMEVKLCTAQDSATAIKTIVPITTISNTSYVSSSNVFSVPANGIYFIGWHVKNDGASYTSLRIDDINLHVSSPLSAQNISSKNNDIKVYPNPSNGAFYFDNLKSFNGPVQITVFDMIGNVVFNQNVNNDNQVLNLEGQPAGIYTVRLSSDTQVQTKLITISR